MISDIIVRVDGLHYRSIAITSLMFMLLELLDPTTPFIRVHVSSGQQSTIGISCIPSHSVSTKRRIQIPEPELYANAGQEVRNTTDANQQIPMQAEVIKRIEIQKPRFMFVPIKLCPEDELS